MIHEKSDNMETLHTYYDGSKLYKISAKSLLQVPIWKGNRIIDMNHVENIKKSVQDNVCFLDSGYHTIQYVEYDQDNLPIKQTYVIDGQHRLSVLHWYFECHPDAHDFYVTITQKKVESEEEAIDYFNKRNNVKSIQYEEDPNMITNRYIQWLSQHYNKVIILIRAGATKRPYLSVDKLREALRKKLHELKQLSVDQFVKKCIEVNNSLLHQLKYNEIKVIEKDKKMVEKMIQLDFALAWDDRFHWLENVIRH
jgi:hypothetical protein